MWEILHRWFGWHHWEWLSPHDDHVQCRICGATRQNFPVL